MQAEVEYVLVDGGDGGGADGGRVHDVGGVPEQPGHEGDVEGDELGDGFECEALEVAEAAPAARVELADDVREDAPQVDAEDV
eukprot:2140653-Rhodomonas_salina.1